MIDRDYLQNRNYMPGIVGGSRRAKVEQKKILRQIVLLIIGAIVVLILFVVVIIPTLIRFLTKKAIIPQANNSTSLELQAPFLSAPVAATSSANIVVTGYGQNGNHIVILDNQQQVAQTNAKSDGSFSTGIALTDGSNALSAYAVDDNNQKSAVSQSYTVLYEKQPPSLDISEPQDQQSIQGKKNQNVTIKGKTKPNAKVTVNDRLVFVNDDGTFTTLYLLSSGSNTLDMKAIDEAGNMTEKKLTVTYSD